MHLMLRKIGNSSAKKKKKIRLEIPVNLFGYFVDFVCMLFRVAAKKKKQKPNRNIFKMIRKKASPKTVKKKTASNLIDFVIQEANGEKQKKKQQHKTKRQNVICHSLLSIGRSFIVVQ